MDAEFTDKPIKNKGGLTKDFGRLTKTKREQEHSRYDNYCKSNGIYLQRNLQPVYKEGEEWNHDSKINISEDSINKFNLKKTIDGSKNMFRKTKAKKD